MIKNRSVIYMEDATAMIKRLGFFDSERNKTGRGVERREYELQRQQDLVLDNATGLIWQRSGLARVNYSKAQNYIRKINTENMAGYADWRLPTLEEGMSLVKPSKNELNVYIDPHFDVDLWWIWTADKSDSEKAWIVDYDLGQCYVVNIMEIDHFHVRAVRTNSKTHLRITPLRSEPLDNLREEALSSMLPTDSMQKFKIDHNPNETVFVMMKIAGDDSAKNKKLQNLYAAIKSEVARFGFEAVRADEKFYERDLWSNVKVYLNGCNYGIAVLENLYSDEMNPNVALEYGYMAAKLENEHHVLLLKEKSYTNIQSDLNGAVWTEFEIDRPETIKKAVRDWLQVDLVITARKRDVSSLE